MNRLRPRARLLLWPFWTALATVILLSVVVATTAGLLLWLGLGRPSVAAQAPLNATELLD